MKNRVQASMVAAVAGLAISSAAHGQTAWSSAVNGSWFDTLRWTAGVPAAGTSTTLGMAGAYTVTMQNGGGACGMLNVSNANAALSLFDNCSLNVDGNIANAGLIQISGPGAPGNLTRLIAAANIQVAGTGTLRLAALGNGDNDTAYLHYTAAGNVLTNAAGHLIAGAGRIYTNLVNNGTLHADQNAKGLLLIDQPKLNNGTITASGGGFVQVRATSLTQGASGVSVSSAGSPVQFVNAGVAGGTLSGVGAGVQFFAANTVDGVTMQDLNAVMDNSFVNVAAGGVINNGTWTVSDPTAPGNLTRIIAAAPSVTIGGTGTIRLQGIGGGNGDNDTAYLHYAAAGNVLTNGASHSIRGYGRVYTNLVNNGAVNADVAGKGILMIDQPKTNNGTMTASNGGFLQFRSVTVTGNPVAQVISTDAASPVQMVNATMTGGGFTTAGSGVFQYFGSNTLSNLTVNGTHQIMDNTLVSIATDLTNNGAWTISLPGAPGNLTRLSPSANVAINGTGTIRLQGVQGGNGDNDTAYLGYSAAGNVLTFGAGQQLRGYGRVYTNVVNNGTIHADNTPNAGGPASKGIVLMDQPKTNNATITSSNAGWWYLRGITMTNNGLLTSSNTTTPGGGFENSTVVGGTISNIADQFFGTVGTVNLNGVTITPGSGVQVNDNSVLRTTGLTNNGTIRVSMPTAPGNLSRLEAAAATTTLSGTGTLRLQGVQVGNGDNTTAYLYYTDAAHQLVNSATHTIAGYGRIYTNLVNNGTVHADNTPNAAGPASKGVVLMDQPKTNNATITSSNAGWWYVRGITLTNGPAGVMSSSNTTTPGGGFENCTIVGGTISNVANQFFGVNSTAAFSGVTITTGSGLQVNDNSMATTDGMTNDGTIAISRVGNPGNLTRLRVTANDATIGGAGTVRLNSVNNTPNDTAYMESATPATIAGVLGPNQTLAGIGRVYHNWTLRGPIDPGQTPTGVGEIQCQSGTITMAGTTQYAVQITGTPASGGYDRLTGNSNKTLAGSVTVAFQPTYTANAGDLFDIVSGPTVLGEFGTVTFQNTPSYVGGPPHVAYPAGAARVVMCYANCDGSATSPRLNVNDFTCFLNAFGAASSLPHAQQVVSYANCDQSTTAPALNVNDFTCFLNKFAIGCP
ncbi:MAG: hypothetical protein JNM80_11565 [Phycisphaerae bacterium]|nr:hypothetical protein [Phycisphaerae bacterium]